MRRFTELLGFYALGGLASFADAGFLWGSSWRLGVDSLEGTAELLRFCAVGGVLVPPVQVSWGYFTMQPWGRGEGVYFRCSGLG
jgi:hypothetical protein